MFEFLGSFFAQGWAVMLTVGIIGSIATTAIVVAYNQKWAELIGALLAVVSGGAIGASLVILHYGVHENAPPRMPDVSHIVWEGDTITFPPPNEVGTRWCIITSKTTQRGVYVPGETYRMDADETNPRTYLRFGDGLSSTTVDIPPGI